jgi:hypothetical protein
MKNLITLALAVGFFCISSASAQTGKVFDNFDTAAGVQVEKPAVAADAKPRTVRKFRNGRWVQVPVNDKLVKKTAQSRPVGSVEDSLALREPLPNGVANRLSMGNNTQLKGFTTGNPLYDLFIVESSRRYAIDPLLIYAQMHQESTFKTFATSHKGASGLMQLMPATARRFGVTKIYDPKQNIDAGVKYMRWLIDTFQGDVVLALAGYNAGEGAVMKYGWRVPPYRETQEYVRRITSRYNSISDGKYIQTARRDPRAANFGKDSRPLTIFEPDALAVKLADGRIMLVNQ